MKKYWSIFKKIIIGITGFAAVLLVIWGVGELLTTISWPDWTGFGTYTTPTSINNQIYFRGKTLWDWMELLLVPFVLAVGAFWFNQAQRKTEQDIAANQQEELLLQDYLDAMTHLILEKNLCAARDKKDVDLRNVARSRTLTVLRALSTSHDDGKNRRRGSLVRFLYETQLINGEKPIISLKKANMERAYMRLYDLQNVNFLNADLYEADLRGANLEGANLEGAFMVKTNLRGANLKSANLNGANLKGAIYGVYEGSDTTWPEKFNPAGTGAVKYSE